MSDALQSVAGGLITELVIGQTLNYSLDYTPDMTAGEALTASTRASAPAGLTLSGSAYTDNTVTIVLSGGVADTWYVVQNLATSSAGLIHQGSFQVFVANPLAFGTGIVSPFPSIAGALASLRRDRLLSLLLLYLPGITFDDDYLLGKLLASTALIQRMLRTHLTPTEMLPNMATPAEIAALKATGATVELEPQYDYDPGMFLGNQWGHFDTRQRPIIALHSIRFTYPTPNTQLFDVPTDWFRVDYKYGVINLVPIQTALLVPLNAFILSALGGGRTVPAFIQIRYSTGLVNVARDWPDILDCILKQTAIGVMEDAFAPTSRNESVSADGLSQSSSIGITLRDYQDLVDRRLETIRQSLFGIRVFRV
jgi:hypothetical protein